MRHKFTKEDSHKGNEVIHKRRFDSYNINPNYCNYCKNILPYKKRRNKFCSHVCSASYINKYRLRNKKIHKICISCGKRVYSSKERCKICEIKFKLENGQHVSKGVFRRYITKIRGHKCEECKNTEWLGKPIPLDLHHLDGNDNNNRNDNLKLLCKNCHALTDNYGTKNKFKRDNKAYIL